MHESKTERRRTTLDAAIVRQRQHLSSLESERQSLEMAATALVKFVNATSLSGPTYAICADEVPEVRSGDVVVVEGNGLVPRNGEAVAVVQSVRRDGAAHSAAATKIVGHTPDSWRCR